MQGEDYTKIGKNVNLRVKYFDKYNKEEKFYLDNDRTVVLVHGHHA